MKLMRFFALLVMTSVWAVSCTAQTGENEKEWVYPDEPGGTDGWRSTLYPDGWTPGYTDPHGNFLHDFSYAGYHAGMRNIPVYDFNVTDVTEAPYNADKTGKKDATAAIQSAIDAVSQKGGGVVLLPAGIYSVSIQSGKSNVLSVTSDKVVIRGEGPDRTFILNTTTDMRSKTIVRFSANASWDDLQSMDVKVSEDVTRPTVMIPLENAGAFAPGDKVMIRSDVTDALRQEMGVGSHWSNMNKGPHFLREVVSVNAETGIVEIDVPVRFALRTRDNACMYKVKKHLQECGLENLAIANVQHPSATGWGEEDYKDSANGSYDVHASHAVKFRNAENCWVRKVHTWRPEGNAEHIHILSNGIEIGESRFVTVTECDFQRSQYEGGGGNGYMYTLCGNDCLLDRCHAEHGRHNYDFKSMTTSGNVIYACSSKDPSLASDFHMHLSMANLIDCFVSDGDHLDAGFRPWGSSNAKHMYTTTESVIWNAKGLKADGSGILVNSLQYGKGYVIGTSGSVSKVRTTPVSGTSGGIQYDTAPEDWVEGVGLGASLVPQSLYKDQLEKRKSRIKEQ